MSFPQSEMPSGADSHMSGLKTSFKQAANSLTQLYKQCTYSYNVAYNQGKNDAYQEILEWFLNEHDSKYRHVSSNQFLAYMQQKLID